VRFVDVHFGWRIARLVLSACVVLVSLPLVRYVLRSEDSPALRVRARPATDVVLLGAVEIELVGVRAGIARRQLTFWMLVVMLLVGTASLAGTAIHLIALFTDKGMNMTTATLIYSAYSLTNVLGHALSGLLLDRINSPRVGIFGYLSGLVSLVLLYSTNSLPGLAVAAVLLGLAFGAEVSLAAYWVARYWGLRSYAEIYGSLYAAVSAGAAVGPWLMGAAFERHGSYHSALGLFILCLACCGVLTWLLRPYRYPIDLESAAI
jgi:MFS family permease